MQRLLLLLILTALAGCSSDSAPELQDAFAEAPPSQTKTLATEAMAAFEQKDYPKAVVNLQSLRSDPTLSVDQTLAVQEMMARVQTELAIRAEQGDPQAQQTLRMLQTLPRR